MAERLDRSAYIHIAYKRALAHNPNDTGNRFKLVHEVAKGARGLHMPERRMEDSLNRALALSGRSAPLPMVMLDADGGLVPINV
jgi:hypothetical protein